MTKIKLCGLTRPQDIEAANALQPDFIGFVFAEKSKRYVNPEQAKVLRELLSPEIRAVGVFVRAEPAFIAELLSKGIIDMAQLHGGEDEDYISTLRTYTDRPIIQAFRVDDLHDIARARSSSADLVLLDNGSGGTGASFDWKLADELGRPYYLAGGLTPESVSAAVRTLHPWAVDVSSGIETEGHKDSQKMRAFVEAVRAASGKDD